MEQPIDPAYLKHEAINRFYALLNALADEHVGNEELSLLKIALPSLLADAEYFEDFSILVKETLEKLTHFSANAKKDNFDILTLIYEFVQENYEKKSIYNFYPKNIIFHIAISQPSLLKNLVSTFQNI